MNINFSQNSIKTFQPKMKSSRASMMEVALLIIIAGLFFWFIILPKKATVSAEQTKLAQAQAQESQTSAALSQLQQLVGQLNSHQQDVADLDQALPLNGRVTTLQILIESLAQSAGVTIGNISVASAETNAVVAGDKSLLSDPYAASRSLQELNGTVFVIGNFDQLEAFLQKIENSGRIMDISALAINSASNGNLNLQITLNAYYLAP